MPPGTPDNKDNSLTPTEVLDWLRHWWDAPREHSKAADWAMVALTVAIALAAFWSACIFQGQLTEMHQAMLIDQRPWITAKDAHIIRLELNQPVQGEMVFSNSGKTPALEERQLGTIYVTNNFAEDIPEMDPTPEGRATMRHLRTF